MIVQATDLTQIRVTLTLVVLSWFAWVAFQAYQLARERVNLEQLKTNQEKSFQDSAKVRSQVESINADTARLAAQGNANAQRILAELQKRGITISPSVKTVPPGNK